MKKLLSVAIASLIGMTFVFGAGSRVNPMMDKAFYLNNPSVWTTKKHQNKGGPVVEIKIDGLTGMSNAPTLASKGFSAVKSKMSGAMSGPGFFRQGARNANFRGYLMDDKDANVTFICKTKEGQVVFKTSLRSLISAGRSGMTLKSELNGRTYAYKVSALKTSVDVQVPPISANNYVSAPAYKIKIHQFMKMGSGFMGTMKAEASSENEDEDNGI